MERVDAQKTYWDEYYQGLGERGSDLDWGGRWTASFLPLLRAAGARDLLELGCGTGNDAARLAGEGFHVVATDLSTEAVAAARQKYGDLVEFRVVDMAAGLPFPKASFDAVMANVALHMFTDAVTRVVLTDIRRVLARAGCFCSTSTRTMTARCGSERGLSGASWSPITCWRRPVRRSDSSRGLIWTIFSPTGR